MKALLFLFWKRLWNSLGRALRQPRLLVPGLLLGFFFLSQVALHYAQVAQVESAFVGSLPGFSDTDLLLGKAGAFLLAIRGLMLLSLFSALNAALNEGSLFFAPSDVDFLFTAPLSRRGVLLARMLGKYLGLLIPAVYLPLTIGGAPLATESHTSLLALWPGFLGAWLYLAAVTNGAQILMLSRSPEDSDASTPQGKRRKRLRRLLTALIILLLAGGGYLATRFLGGQGVVDVGLFARAVHSEWISRTLLPDAWVADLFRVAFDGWHQADCWRLAGLTTLCAVSFWGLFAYERDFYEAASDASARRAQMTEAVRSGNAGAILSQMAQEGKLARGTTLTPFGGGAKAIFWKDCISLTRAPVRSWIQLLVLASIPAFLAPVVGQRGDVTAIFWTTMFALQMSSFFLLSLRDMLRRADISKALPIPPWKFLSAELALSACQLTLLGWFSLAVMYVAGIGRGPLGGVMAALLPSLCILLLMVQTIFVLLYPNTGDTAQAAIAGVVSLLTSLAALLPSLCVGVGLYFMETSLPLLTLLVTLCNLAEATIALGVATWLWQRYDPTN